jgi:uncharacterized membrane protein
MVESEENGEEREEMEEQAVPSRLLLLFAAGFVLVFVGALVLIAAAALGTGGSASAGIVVFIGPFPIVFGVGPDAVWLILIGVILAVVNVVLFMVMRRKKALF